MPLLFRPGFLTKQYVAGKRVAYLSPLKMYLTISAVFFLILSSTPHISGKIIQTDFDDTPTAAGIASDRKEIAKDTKEIADDARKLTDSKTGPNALSDLKREIASDRKEIADDQARITDFDHSLKKPSASKSPPQTQPRMNGTINFGGNNNLDLSDLPSTLEEFQKQQRNPATAHKYSPFWQNVIVHIYKLKTGDKQSFVHKWMDTIPKMMFFLLPLFALSLQLLYLRSKRFYVEHLVFALHSHAFLFVVLGIITLLGMPPLEHYRLSWLGTLFFCSLPLYFLIAMRVFYQQSWGKTVLKFLLAGMNYVFLLIFAFLGTLAVAFLSF